VTNSLDPRLVAILRCPHCKGILQLEREASLECRACSKAYRIVHGIPDLRVYEDPLISLEDDFAKGEKIHLQAQSLGFADLVRYYWSLPTYPDTPIELRDRFINHVLKDEQRCQSYAHRLGSGDRFLEVGCGTAALTKVVHGQFKLAVGCDVAFRWLLVARKRLEEAGLPANLVCCCADYLPFAADSFDTVASVAVLERLDDSQAAISESARVLRSRGRVFAWTANRFSVAPEPHVRVWGVGFLPRRWMAPYVKLARGMAYDHINLLSIWEIRRYCRAVGLERLELALPVISDADWSHLRGMERLAAHVFQLAAEISPLAGLLRIISPVILFTAYKPVATGVVP